MNYKQALQALLYGKEVEYKLKGTTSQWVPYLLDPEADSYYDYRELELPRFRVLYRNKDDINRFLQR